MQALNAIRDKYQNIVTFWDIATHLNAVGNRLEEFDSPKEANQTLALASENPRQFWLVGTPIKKANHKQQVMPKKFRLGLESLFSRPLQVTQTACGLP
jgi:hypothetical protein